MPRMPDHSMKATISTPPTTMDTLLEAGMPVTSWTMEPSPTSWICRYGSVNRTVTRAETTPSNRLW